MLFNRQEPKQLKKFIITVGNNSTGAGNAVCRTNGGEVIRNHRIINQCDPPLNGRFVHVKLKGKKQLNLCEVEVYESAGTYYCSTAIGSVPHPHI